MNVTHEAKQILIHLDDFCAFGVYTPSRYTQICDTGQVIDVCIDILVIMLL